MKSRHKPQSNWSDGKVDHGWPAMSPKVETEISRHAVGESWPYKSNSFKIGDGKYHRAAELENHNLSD
jgi:hypothetical protein